MVSSSKMPGIEAGLRAEGLNGALRTNINCNQLLPTTNGKLGKYFYIIKIFILQFIYIL